MNANTLGQSDRKLTRREIIRARFYRMLFLRDAANVPSPVLLLTA